MVDAQTTANAKKAASTDKAIKDNSAKPDSAAIVDWLTTKIDGNPLKDSCHDDGGSTSSGDDTTRSDRLNPYRNSCTLRSEYSEIRFLTDFDKRDHSFINHFHERRGWFELPLNKLNPESVVVTRATLCLGEGRTPTLYAVQLRTTDAKRVIVGHDTRKSKYDNDETNEHKTYDPVENDLTESEVDFYFKDETLAERVAKAFKDLIAQCGGKGDTKEIY